MALNILKNDDTPVLGVLFDMDGVVIDSESLYTRFWMEAAGDLGFPMTREQALQMRSLNPGLAKARSSPSSVRRPTMPPSAPTASS